MSADARGMTGPGRRAAMPAGQFDGPAPVELDVDGRGLVVTFVGDDGRQAEFPLSRLTLPGWIRPLGRAFAARVGPAGSTRTRTGASGIWVAVVQFVDYLSELPMSPDDPSRLKVEHITGFASQLQGRYKTESTLWDFVRRVTSVLKLSPIWESLPQDVQDYLRVRRPGLSAGLGRSGYSDGELRRLITRLRQDVAAIRDRVQTGQELAERFRHAPDGVEPQLRDHARLLAEIAETGIVPEMRDLRVPAARIQARRRLAMQLFLVPSDLVPLSALFIVLSDRNIETIKELPADCRVLEDRAIELTLTKRRRGAGRWFETVHWEIGTPGKELHHPGGLFLMVQRLTALSRRFSEAERLWALWRNGWHRAGVTGVEEHYDPYTKHLQWPFKVSECSDRQEGLWADPVDGQERTPLVLDCVRLRKSMEVRRTRQTGGHLPSAARSNTYPVLFSNYLRGDATAREWAHDVVSTALVDAEEAAWQAHQRALTRAGGHLRVISGEPSPQQIERSGIPDAAAERVAAGEQDTPGLPAPIPTSIPRPASPAGHRRCWTALTAETA